jgi:hypothetical protein
MRDESRRFERETRRDERAEYRERRALEFEERDARRDRKLRDLEERGERLTREDCMNAVIDGKARAAKRLVRCRGRGEWAYEWTTVTDEYQQIGLTYFLRDGHLSIVAFKPRNARLFDGKVRTADDLEAAIQQASAVCSALTAPRSTKRRSAGRQVYVRCHAHVTDTALRAILAKLRITASAVVPAMREHSFAVTVVKPMLTRAVECLNQHADIILATTDRL